MALKSDRFRRLCQRTHEGKKYIKIPMSKLSRLFRQANFTVENFLDTITDILNHLHDQSEHV